MRKVLFFIMKGLPLSIPLGVLAAMGLSGGGGGAVFAWIGIVLGLPWNVLALAVGLGTVLSGQGLVGQWSIQLAVVWACVSLSINCSLIIAGFLRLSGKLAGSTQEP
jgi:hypothetical protein